MKRLPHYITYFSLCLVVALSSIALVGFLPVQVNAMSAEDCKNEERRAALEDYFASQNISFYDPCSTACASPVGGAITSLKGEHLEDKISGWLMEKGLNAAAASGIMGNMAAESGLNPFRFQGGVTSTEELLNAGNTYGKAWGLVQWDGVRRVNVLKQLLTKYPDYRQYISPTYGGSADAYGAAPEEVTNDFILFELEYIYMESSTGGNRSTVWEGLKKYPNSEDGALEAAVFFHDVFEGSSDSPEKVREGTRGTRAKEFFTQLSSASTGNEKCDATPSGSVTYYSQVDPQWAAKVYAGSTIARVGCGPTSMAMILATLVDRNITPVDVAAVAGDQSQGTSSHINLINGVNATWGTNISSDRLSMDEAIEFVKSGKGFVWMGGQGSAPFTSVGHLVAMVGVKDDGSITIADPYSPPHEKIKDYSRAHIEATSFSRYGVPKP